jgi:hypothetical protein
VVTALAWRRPEIRLTRKLPEPHPVPVPADGGGQAPLAHP